MFQESRFGGYKDVSGGPDCDSVSMVPVTVTMMMVMAMMMAVIVAAGQTVGEQAYGSRTEHSTFGSHNLMRAAIGIVGCGAA
jgi:phosphoglycerate dehydrogenase-like enzyme